MYAIRLTAAMGYVLLGIYGLAAHGARQFAADGGTFIMLRANGNAMTCQMSYSSGGEPAFDYNDLGLFSVRDGNTLTLSGFANTTYESSGSDIFKGRLAHRVYAAGTEGGTFVTNISDDWKELAVGWERHFATNLNVNLLSELTGGTYNLEVYALASGNFTPPLIENNNGSNFIATFTVTTASLENAGIHFNRDGKTSVSFSCTTNTGYGRELYVVGSHPDVGNWTPTEARKLYWTSGNVWTGHIAIEAGTALEYKYIIRTNTADAFTNAGNVIWMPGNNLSVNMPGQSPGPYDAKSFYYYSGWSNVSLVYQCGTDTNWYSTNMSVYGQGRTPDEYVYHVDGFGRPGALLTFTVSGYSVTQQWDHSPATGGNYYTPLDTVLLRDGQIYNYWPTGALDASRIETTYITSAWAPTIPSRNIRVYLPRGYNQNTQKCYPVLYMHDGQNDFRPGGAFGCWYAEDTADDLISLGMMRETVIVAVDNTSERNREYIPPMDDCGDGQGTADQYANFLIHDVKTYVDGNYRTLPDRNNTLTLGSSFGGNVSMYLGLATNVFSKVGPMSPAFWAATNFIQDYIVDGDASGLRIYMDMGTEEGTGAWVRVWNVYNDLLADDYTVNDTLRMEAGAGQEHNEAAWAQRLPMPFSFLMDIRDEPNELTLQEHPARISGFVAEDGTPSIRFDGLQGFAFVLQKTASLSSPEWNAICTGAVENAMWGSQQLVDTNTLDAQSTYRTLALPLNQQAE